MSCCGKKRESIKSGRTVSINAADADKVFLAPRVPIVFCGTGPYLVEGPLSREVYYFSPKQAEQLIDGADAAVLLKSNLFRRKNVAGHAAALSVHPRQETLQQLKAEDSTES